MAASPLTRWLGAGGESRTRDPGCPERQHSAWEAGALQARAGAPALIVHGHIERQERAVNVVTERIEALPVAVDIPERTHSFR